jgi:hypothetical protein
MNLTEWLELEENREFEIHTSPDRNGASHDYAQS